MAFRPNSNDYIAIDGTDYRIAEHPSALGMPYGQEGRQAVVYQLIDPHGALQALKVFKVRFRLPTMVLLSERLSAFAGLDGLEVCHRTVLTSRRHTSLLAQHPDLIYSVLMPWINGSTWMDVLLDQRQLAPSESLRLAQSLTNVLAGMEERGLAHCDLSSANLLVGDTALSTEQQTLPKVALVDVEQLYAPGLDRPDVLPGGSAGYAHKTAPAGLWSAQADRFAGAVLLVEMLGWCDERVRSAAYGESFFDPNEIHTATQRYALLVQVLRERWGGPVAGLFERAWHSTDLLDCPTFGEWLVLLAHVQPIALGAGQWPAAAPVPDTAYDLPEQRVSVELQGNARLRVTAENMATSETEAAPASRTPSRVVVPYSLDVPALPPLIDHSSLDTLTIRRRRWPWVVAAAALLVFLLIGGALVQAQTNASDQARATATAEALMVAGQTVTAFAKATQGALQQQQTNVAAQNLVTETARAVSGSTAAAETTVAVATTQAQTTSTAFALSSATSAAATEAALAQQAQTAQAQAQVETANALQAQSQTQAALEAQAQSATLQAQQTARAISTARAVNALRATEEVVNRQAQATAQAQAAQVTAQAQQQATEQASRDMEATAQALSSLRSLEGLWKGTTSQGFDMSFAVSDGKILDFNFEVLVREECVSKKFGWLPGMGVVDTIIKDSKFYFESNLANMGSSKTSGEFLSSNSASGSIIGKLDRECAGDFNFTWNATKR